MKKNILLASIICFVFTLAVSGQSGAAALATEPKPKLTAAQQKVMVNYLLAKNGMAVCNVAPDSAECKKDDFDKMFSDSLEAIVADSTLVFNVLTSAAGSYEGGHITTRSAMQVSQIADEQNVQLIRLIVAQNQKMIELLQQLVKKRP